MAKSNKIAQKKHPLIMRKHIELLGGEGRYIDWCKAHGYAESFDKTAKQIEVERDCFLERRRWLAANARLHRNPKKLLEDIFFGAIHSSQIERPQWKAVAREIEAINLSRKEAKSLLAFCSHILRVGDFLLDNGYLTGLIRLHTKRLSWLRPFEDWLPTSHNSERQFRSLTRHLLARYDVPAFFDQVWLQSSEAARKHQDWYVHIGWGGNIREMDTPVLLTKMMAHHMMLAPENYSIEGTLRWGQIHALGGDQKLVEAVCGTHLINNFSNDAFWLSVFRFFIENPLLDRLHVGPIVDYLNHQKFEDRTILNADNRLITLPPAQPNLTMRGRTVEALLAQMENWHRALSKETKVTGEIFKPSGFKGLRMELQDESVWIVSELLSTGQLQEEGRKMRHCVSSYARSCLSGENSIWTMEHHAAKSIEKKQTIQVTKAGQIVQCRGKLNRLPTAGEFSVLQRWARHAGLAISSHVKPA